MSHPRTWSLWVVALTLLASGCRVQPATAPPKSGAAGAVRVAPGVSKAVLGVELAGSVKAPGYLINLDGGSLRSPSQLINLDGGSLKANGGQNYRVGAGRRLHQSPAVNGVKGARVYLADATNTPLPGVKPVSSDSSGQFRLTNVPPGTTWVVVSEIPTAGGKTALFRTLARVEAASATAVVDPASTLVTLSVLEGGDLAAFDAGGFQKAVDAAARSLTPRNMPDFSDVASVRRALEQLTQQVAALRESIEGLRKGLTELRQRVDQLETRLPEAGSQRPDPTLGWRLSTLAGDGLEGDQDGEGAAARFDSPLGLAFGPDGALFVADAGNGLLRRVTLGGQVSTPVRSLSGLPVPAGGSPRRLGPGGLWVGTDGAYLVADVAWGEGTEAMEAGRLLRIAPDGKVQVLVGPGLGGPDGFGDEPRSDVQTGLVAAPDGSVYLADGHNHCIRKLSPQGQWTVYAGARGGGARQDGPREAARFNDPSDLALGPDGTLYVADTGNHCIRTISPDGMVSTLAGSADGFRDGLRDAARFDEPEGLALGANGEVFVADTGNDRIRRISPDGTVATLAGSEEGFEDGVGARGLLSGPADVAVGPDGAVYVADWGNHSLRKLVPAKP